MLLFAYDSAIHLVASRLAYAATQHVNTLQVEKIGHQTLWVMNATFGWSLSTASITQYSRMCE